MKLGEEIDSLFDNIVSYETCPIGSIDKIERLEIETLIKFLAENLRIYNDPPNKYKPLVVFARIRDKYKQYHTFLPIDDDKTIDNLKKVLKKKYNSEESFNTSLIDNIEKCQEKWETYEKQEAINIFHSLMLYIFACDLFSKHPPARKLVKKFVDTINKPTR